MIRAAALFCLSITALSGCSQFPELERTDSEFVKSADYPALVSLNTLDVTSAHDASVDEAARLQARAAALRARARRLKALDLDAQ